MASTDSAGPANGSVRSGINTPTKGQPMGQSTVQYQDGEELENSRLQLLWNKHMEPAYKNPSGYLRTSVILISWDEKLDDLGTKDEVNKLEAVLQDRYNYTTTSRRINGERKAQVQVNKYLSEWVFNEDEENVLLIVYYAGHGVPGPEPGQLRLAPSRTPNQDPSEFSEVVWNNAEATLGDTKADVLVIFDCCHAGDLGRSGRRNIHPRSFEFIGATSAGALTKIPGKASFTTALIWALEKLADDRDTFPFTTSTLVREIRNAPDFPKTQVPILAERSANSFIRIQLSRMSIDNDVTPPQEISNGVVVQTLDPHYLELRFAFDGKPRDWEIKRIAQALCSLIKQHDVSARRVDWGGLHSSDMFKIAASKFKESGRRRARRASGISLHVPSTPSTPGLPTPALSHGGSGEGDAVETWRKCGMGGELDREVLAVRGKGQGSRVLLIDHRGMCECQSLVALAAVIGCLLCCLIFRSSG